MTTCLALLLAVASAQAEPAAGDDVAALKAQIAKLEQENAALRGEVARLRKDRTDSGLRAQLDALEAQALGDAQTIIRLKNALKVLESKPAVALPVATPEQGPSRVGPQDTIQARVEVVDAKMGFLVIAKGREDGIEPGFRFDIFREVAGGNGPTGERKTLGVAEVEKFLDSASTLSKLKVVEGDVTKMRAGDRAVALRKLGPRKDPGLRVPAPEDTRLGIYKITGRSGEGAAAGFIISYGSDLGAAQSDTLFVYKDNRLKARMRIDVVHNQFCVAQVIDGTQVQEPAIGDHVFTKELKKTVVGRVRINDDTRGILIDVGEVNHGVRTGDLFEVRRLGRKVGILQVTTADRYHSYAKPFGDTNSEEIRIGDHVERIDTK